MLKECEFDAFDDVAEFECGSQFVVEVFMDDRKCEKEKSLSVDLLFKN